MNSQNMDRRDFLKSTGAGLAALTFPVPLGTLGTTQRRAAGEAPVLVCLYLRGGMDALNCIVPYKEKRYYEIRPTISIAPKKTQDEEGVIPLDKKFAMHPAMRPMESLYKSGDFAPIVCCGSPHPTRSHFDAQDFMEYAAPGIRTITNGWLNRYLQQSQDRWGKDSELRALAMQGLLPRSLRGDYPVLAVPNDRRRGTDTGQLLDLFDELYKSPEPTGKGSRQKGAAGKRKMKMGKRPEDREDAVIRSGEVTIKALRRFKEIQAKAGKNQLVYPKSGFGPKLQGIARVIKSGEAMEVAAADWNGWDHHINEGNEDGRIAQMLGSLSQSLASFMKDIGEHRKRTVVLVMTEFGRTCRENGNRGTDHGHGGLMFAVGGPVKGGKVFGQWPGLEDKDMNQNRDLAVTTDFRDVFNEVLRKHMQVKRMSKDFFPNYKPRKGPGILG
jgi:uncharacterized protein (DUF1501 family)